MTKGNIDFDRLFKLRLVVARVGELVLAKSLSGNIARHGIAS
jgi:hypothetical protein